MTLLEAFARNARVHPRREAIRFLATGEDPAACIAYAELHRAMEEVAAGIAARGLTGRPIVLAIEPGIEFVIATLACFRAGAFAVTIPFPANAARERVSAIVRDARPAAILVDTVSKNDLPAALTRSDVPVLRLEDVRETGGFPAQPARDAPALIQYSSGSTRTPCGVVITHGNLAANLAMLRGAFAIRSGDVGVSWLPPSHDMGLIGTILTPLFVGGTAVLMPPAAFIARPIRWLRAIDRYRSAISGGPNFAYEICDRRISVEAARELDLTSWRVAYCGSEPIRTRTLDTFARRFAVAGFSRDRFVACYGLAEATLLVSSGPLRDVALAPSGAPRVSAGRPPAGCDVHTLPETGELFVAGDHVSPGSWSGTRRCVVPWNGTREVSGKRFVATGDLGAIVDREVVVLERKKDVMAIHGRKLHAIDVEDAALDAGERLVETACAFSIDSDLRERLVLLCEIGAGTLRRIDPEAARVAIAKAVGAATGIVPEVAILRNGVLPRTSSGKIIRHVCRSAYLSGAFALRDARPSASGTS